MQMLELAADVWTSLDPEVDSTQASVLPVVTYSCPHTFVVPVAALKTCLGKFS